MVISTTEMNYCHCVQMECCRSMRIVVDAGASQPPSSANMLCSSPGFLSWLPNWPQKWRVRGTLADPGVGSRARAARHETKQFVDRISANHARSGQDARKTKPKETPTGLKPFLLFLRIGLYFFGFRVKRKKESHHNNKVTRLASTKSHVKKKRGKIKTRGRRTMAGSEGVGAIYAK